MISRLAVDVWAFAGLNVGIWPSICLKPQREENENVPFSLGGDGDTMACIAGGIAEAFYGEVPADIEEVVRRLVPKDLIDVLDRFYTFVVTGNQQAEV